MSYNKYVRRIELYNITFEPTEYIEATQLPSFEAIIKTPDDHLVIYIIVSIISISIIITIIIYRRNNRNCL
jgi:hypothetical protein